MADLSELHKLVEEAEYLDVKYKMESVILRWMVVKRTLYHLRQRIAFRQLISSRQIHNGNKEVQGKCSSGIMQGI